MALINGIFGDRARSELVVVLIICGRRTATSSMDPSERSSDISSAVEGEVGGERPRKMNM